MPIEKLISYPELPVVDSSFLEAFMNDDITSETLFKYGVKGSLRSTISVRLLQNHEIDPVFIVGETVQSFDDEFNRDVGKRIADGRALAAKEAYEDYNWKTFSYSEAKTMVEDPFKRMDKDQITMVSSVTLPLSGLPLPHGIVNRLKMLCPRT